MCYLFLDAYPASNIWVSGPHLENLQKWSLLNTNVSIKNSDVVNNCEIIFLGIKPNKLETAVQQCLNGIESLSKKKSILFVSMLAGRKINDLQEVNELYLYNQLKRTDMLMTH